MGTKQQAIHQLIHSIINYIEKNKTQTPGATLILQKLAQMELTPDNMCDATPQSTRHDDILNQAIAGITAPGLNEIAINLQQAKEHLVWREDEGKYYQSGANLGEGYRNCNLHSLLIGPGACGFEQADFNFGIFMLGPRTLYRDHRHTAPELYLNLSERSGWRLHGGDWQDYPAGSLIWNASGEVHATRVYEQPFISVFSWLKDIHEPCEVVAMDDWNAIEQALWTNDTSRTS
ncbi:MAG: dimethylsulfonioproprionate lyase family protein [Thiolinea sp.]